MKNTKMKKLFSAVVFLALSAFAFSANAAANYLYVVPASLTQGVARSFSISVEVNTLGDKICAVKGTLIFNGLTCQSITLADGLMAQTMPTCSKPNFLIGIPQCVTTNKSLFSVLIKGENPGVTTIGFSGVNVIGAGASIGSTSVGGTYNISAVSGAVAPSQETTPQNSVDSQVTPFIENQEATSASVIPPDKDLTASITDNSVSPTVIWILAVVMVLVAIYFVIKKGRKKKV
jgi:hypothetical protein